MRGRLLTVVVAGATAVGLAGCAAFDPDAATVNGTSITRGSFEDELDSLRDNETFVNAVGTPVEGQLANSVSTTFAAGELTNRIRAALVGDELEERGITIDPAVRSAGAALAPSVFLGGGADPAAVLGSLSTEERERLETWSAEALALAVDESSGGDVPQYLVSARESFPGVCLLAAAVGGEAEATAAVAALQSGTSMTEVVTQYGVPQSGLGPNGELPQPCFPREQLATQVPELAAAQPGAVVGPVNNGATFLVLQVIEPDDVSLLSQALGDPAYQAWQQQALAEADVYVDPRYGAWDPETATVVPPGAAL